MFNNSANNLRMAPERFMPVQPQPPLSHHVMVTSFAGIVYLNQCLSLSEHDLIVSYLWETGDDHVVLYLLFP